MRLPDLIDILPEAHSFRVEDVIVSQITDDSRKVDSSSIFVAIKGEEYDGHDFIEQVIEKEPAAIVANRVRPAEYHGLWIQVFDTRQALAKLAAQFAGHPASAMGVIGVTGTNGKTTVTHFLRHLLEESMLRTGMIGTVKVHDGKGFTDATHTTPGPMELQTLLAKMKDNGCRAVAMEVSSHGLEQARTGGMDFRVGVFMNLTQDHLDYHGDMETYYQAKRLLFSQMAESGSEGTAVINIDDAYGERLAEEFQGQLQIITFGFKEGADLHASNVRGQFYGQEFALTARGRDYLVRLPNIGRFNVLNAVAAIGAAAGLGLRIRDVIKHLGTLPQTPGRMECVGGEAAPVFVDYAHTPDALEKVCETLLELNPNHLITVFGCGGDRDKEKRPLMGAAAAKHSHFCVVTSDNPRTEKPWEIIDQVTAGMGDAKFEVVPDRKAAISRAIEISRARDIVLIAGKGHESYQEVNGHRNFFDDREEARKAVQIFQKARDQKREELRMERAKQRRDASPPEED